MIMRLLRTLCEAGPDVGSIGVARALVVSGLLWSPAVAIAPAAPAAEVPTARGAFLGYKTAIQIALERHPLLKRAQESAQAAEAMTGQALAAYYPQVDAYVLQTGGTIRPLSAFNIAGAQNKPTSYVENAGFRADQLLYDFGQTAHKVLAEQATQAAAEKEILTHKALVILQVQQAYVNGLRQRRLVAIAEETVRERGVLRDQVESLYKRQLKSKLDLDLIAVELRNAEVQLLQAKNELRAAFAALNHAMGVQGPDEYTLEEVPLERPAATLEALIQDALADRPELLSTHDRLRAAEERLGAAKALALPTITAMGLIGVTHFSDAPLNQYAGSHAGQTNLWWGAAATLNVPLFTGFLIENRVAEARAQQRKTEQHRIELANRIVLEVTDAYATLQAATQQVAVEALEVAAARSALTLAKDRYRLGLASIVDVTTATTSLMAAEVRLSEARYAEHLGAAAVAYATGKASQSF